MPQGETALLQINAAGITADLRTKEITVLTGTSGSGKTRLLRALADLDPHDYRLALQGKTHTHFAANTWRQQVQYLPAEPVWWTDTASELIASSALNHAEAIGLSSSLLSQPVHQLSTGERQRAALLRALSVEPKILLLDEPTAALDESSTKKIETLLQHWVNNSERAILWVSHSREQKQRVASQEWQMNNGQLTCL